MTHNKNNDEAEQNHRAAAALHEIVRATGNDRPIPEHSLRNLKDATDEITTAEEWRQTLRDS